MDSTKGGLLVGHTDKDGGKGITVQAPEGEIRMGGGEIIINEAAAKENCETLSKINQSTGGVAIPCNMEGNTDTNKNPKTLLYGGQIDYFGTQIDDKDYQFHLTIEECYNYYKSNKTILLGALISHPELFEKYPQIKEVKVTFGNILNEDEGANSESQIELQYYKSKIFLNLHFDYYEKYGREEFELSGSNPEYSKEGVVLHEIQHLLQQSDRRYTGRSYESIRKETSERRRDLDIKVVEFAAYLKYKKQPAEQEAMKTVYYWLQSIGLRYGSIKYIIWDPQVNPEQGDAQEHIYDKGGMITKAMNLPKYRDLDPNEAQWLFDHFNDKEKLKKTAEGEYYVEVDLTINSGNHLTKTAAADLIHSLEKKGYGYEIADDFTANDKTFEFIHAIRMFENNKQEITDKFTITLKTIEDVTSGKREVENGKAIQAAINYLRTIKGDGQTDGENKNSKSDQEDQLKEYANSNNLWVSKSDIYNFYKEGYEQRVYLIDGSHVLKLNSAIFYDNWQDYFTSLLLNNLFFPATSYELIGFIQQDNKLYSVVKQALVFRTEHTAIDYVKKQMSEIGFDNIQKNDYYNKYLNVSMGDLHEENVLTKDGELYFIDTICKIGKDKNKSNYTTMESGGSVEEKITERLQDRQKGKEFKDTGVVTYTRKYRAAYDIISYADLQEIEKDNVAAYKLIEKVKIWPVYNVNELKEQGNSSGAAYLKVKCREFLSSRPLDSKEARDVYVKNVTKLRGRLELLKTVGQVKDYLEEFADLDKFDFGDISHFGKSWYISSQYKGNLAKYSQKEVEKYFEDIFSKKFYNFCRFKSDPARKVLAEAFLYEAFSKETRDAMIDERYNRSHASLERYTTLLEKVKAAEDDKDTIRKLITDSAISFFEYNYQKEFVINYLERYITRFSGETKESISAGLPKAYAVREDDWSWSDIVEKKAAPKEEVEEKPRQPQNIFEKYGLEEPKVLKRVPLDYVKRTGGLEVGDVSTKAVLDNYGFKNVIYGNYVNDSESKEHTKHFLGAMIDLVEVLNIDIKDINSLGGLDINIVATGCGAFSPAFACYFPSLKAINITKKRGDGSIAHEWGHYLDNVLAEETTKRATKIEWATSDLEDHKLKSSRVQALFTEYKNYLMTGGERKKIKVLFYPQKQYRYGIYEDTLAAAITKVQTRYPRYADYKNFDLKDVVRYYGYMAYKLNNNQPIEVEMNTTATKYWIESSRYAPTSYYLDPQELFARMFEAVVEYKLVKKNRVSNYLVDIKAGMGIFGAIIPRSEWPYPSGTELEWLSDWIDRLFSAIRVDYNIKPFNWDTIERVDEYTDFKPTKNEEQDASVATELNEEVTEFIPGYSFRQEHVKDKNGENRIIFRLLTDPNSMGKGMALTGKQTDIFIFSLKPFGIGKRGYGIGNGMELNVPTQVSGISGTLDQAKADAIEYFKNKDTNMENSINNKSKFIKWKQGQYDDESGASAMIRQNADNLPEQGDGIDYQKVVDVTDAILKSGRESDKKVATEWAQQLVLAAQWMDPEFNDLKNLAKNNPIEGENLLLDYDQFGIEVPNSVREFVMSQKKKEMKTEAKNNITLYTKQKGESTFKASDLKGHQVSNLVHAARVHPDKLEDFKVAVASVAKDNPTIIFQIREMGTNKVLFDSEKESGTTHPIATTTLTEGIDIGDEGMWHGGEFRVTGFDGTKNVVIEELNSDGEIIELSKRGVSLSSFKHEFAKFPIPNINTHTMETTYTDLKSCLLKEGDDENLYLFEGKEFVTNETGKNEKWKIKSFFKYGIIAEHLPKNKLHDKKKERKLTFDELKQLYIEDEITIDGIDSKKMLEHCLALLSKCIDVIDSITELNQEKFEHNETKKKIEEVTPIFVTEMKGIKVGNNYDHELFGKVEIISIESNIGDKKHKIPYLVTMQLSNDKLETQGIDGFVRSTTPKGPNHEETKHSDIVAAEKNAMEATKSESEELAEAIRITTDICKTLKGKEKKECQEALAMLNDMLPKTMETGGAIPNNYAGKTSREVWDLWNESQRRHFLMDHKHDFKGLDVMDHGPDMWNEYSIDKGLSAKFEDLPFGIREELSFHIHDGQYDGGGKLKKGTIANQYEGKTPDVVWNEWTKEQREHFLSDHTEKINAIWKSEGNVHSELNAEQWATTIYQDLPPAIHNALKEHVEAGQFDGGGQIPTTTDNSGGIDEGIEQTLETGGSVPPISEKKN